MAASARAQSGGITLDLEPITSVSSGEETSWASEVHLHLEPAAGAFLGAEGPGSRTGFGLALKADFPLFTRRMLMVAKMVTWIMSLGATGLGDDTVGNTPLSIQVELFGNRFSDTRLLDKGWGWGGGLGARLKFFENPHADSSVRSVWYDFNVNLSPNGFGVDTALGLQLSLGELVSMGPFVKFARVGGVNGLFGGISLDLGAPAKQRVSSEASAAEGSSVQQP
ncbi:hypothetical protein [Myxococcus landrumensis]|uniref:Uncharacterized protein n=1 Tax=Myxococcus landrumensis TaxID=2813577 RepID=A0ABX7NIX5_9BACT|nr:hypothetical protein [Myxococcus landrumus]QSQ17497.1 hypothetical protein JY572_16280 [Myxococcus landrumus]